MQMDFTALAHRLGVLRGSGLWHDDDVDRLGRVIASSKDWDLFRINPFELAEQHGLDPHATVDMFVHGVKIGLFELVWSCVCAFCGAVEYTYDSIDRVPRQSVHCTRCDVDIDTWLDERVEVSFSVHSSVAALSIDPFADLASYRRYHTSSALVHTPDTAAYLQRAELGHVLLPGHGSVDMQVTLPHDGSLRLLSYDRHAQLLLHAAASAAPSSQPLAVEVLPTGFAVPELRAAAGPLRLRLSNPASQPTGVVVLDGDAAGLRHQVETRRGTTRSFLSGQGLLCTQSFRELFHVQTLDEELALNVRYVALVFTDLVRSTALYERIGDVAAYGLVRAHFRELGEVIRANGGAVVKTMGDAVMAAFASASDAIRAALEMLARIDAQSRGIGAGHDFALRIGVHGGPAIVVSAGGRLDYFGHVVNVAARIQAIAEPNTLCLTTEVLERPGVAPLLATLDRAGPSELVVVRGLSRPVAVRRVARPPSRRSHALTARNPVV